MQVLSSDFYADIRTCPRPKKECKYCSCFIIWHSNVAHHVWCHASPIYGIRSFIARPPIEVEHFWGSHEASLWLLDSQYVDSVDAALEVLFSSPHLFWRCIRARIWRLLERIKSKAQV